MFKKTAASFFTFTLVLFFAQLVYFHRPVSGLETSESSYTYRDFIKVRVAGRNVKLYDRPSARGRVVMNVIRFEDDTGHVFLENGKESYLYDTGLLAEVTPIRDSANNSMWYKLVYMTYLRHDPDVHLWRLDELNAFGRTTAYINSKDLAMLDSTDDEIETLKGLFESLEYERQGRPPLFNVGDSLAKVKADSGGHDDTYRSAKTKVNAKLYGRPDKNSQTFNLPRGTAIIDPIPWEDHILDAGSNPDIINPLGLYYDTQYHDWYAIIDAKNRKVIGWVDSSEHDFKVKHFGMNHMGNPVPNALLPDPSEADIENSKKIFIY